MNSKHRIREIHVVANTHWDREFRETFEITRRQLLDMFDVTINLLEADPRYASFMLDAHAVLVEDYLEIRPERRAAISRLLQARRLFMGPWYTLPDSMNVGGESLVRNFLRARQVAKDLGAECMRVGYTPNNWGQPSQMPQIFRGFGIDSALIYRGISLHECPSEFLWAGADGSEVYGHRFGKLARYNWYYLVYRPVTRGVKPTDKLHPLAGSPEKPFRIADGRSRATANFRLLEPAMRCDREAIVPALEAMLDLEGPDSSSGLFLAMHGHDISVAHPADPEMVEIAQEELAGRYDVRFSNLEDFVARLRESVDREKLVRLSGERRMNLKEGFWTYLLPSTISARTYLKVLNTETENGLIQEAEPLCTLAAVLGAEYPARYFSRAWGFLLGNHTHDANAGCAPDRVCADMEYRFRQCQDIANLCSEDAMRFVAQHIRPAAGHKDAQRLLVFNSLPYSRDEVVRLEIALPQPTNADTVELVAPDGKIVPTAVETAETDSLFVDNPWDVPTYAEVKRFRLHALLTDLPALGYRAYSVRPAKQAAGTLQPIAPAADVLENEHVRVTVRPDGTVDLRHKPTGREYTQLNYLRDQGEVGNAWSQDSPQEDTIIESRGGQARLTLVQSDTLAATIRVELSLDLPTDCPDRSRRSATRKTMPVQVAYTLYRGDPRLHVKVQFDNVAKDHWLRAMFPTGLQTDVVHADTHFDIVTRPIAHPDDKGWIERFRGTAPMHQMVDLNDGVAGLAVLTTGLFEYEVFDEPTRPIALSLVRSFPIRLQVSEEKLEVLPDTGVQCPGPQSFRYAILAHAGTTIDAQVLSWAQRFNTPPRAAQLGGGAGGLPEQLSLVAVQGPGLVATAVKRAEAGDAFLVRLFNADMVPRAGRVVFGRPVQRVRRAELDESPKESMNLLNNGVDVAVGPKKILTLLVEFRKPV